MKRRIPKSKTIWANAIIALVVRLWPEAGQFVVHNPEIAVALHSALNIGLRFVTKKAVEWTGKKPEISIDLVQRVKSD